MSGKKRVLTVHGRTEVARKLKPFTKKVLELVNKKVIPSMDAVTTVTPYLNEFIKENYSKENTYLPHGFQKESSLEANIIRNEFGLDKDSYYLALGRLTPSKGFDTIIEAYKLLPSSSKKLVIAGPCEGEYTKYLKSLISEDFQENIIFTGNVEGRKLSELYSNAFLYLTAIENMGLSLTVLEAIGYKTPVITSNIAEDNYEINNYTHRFENKNSKDLANLISSLDESEQKRLKFIDSAYDCVVKNHSWDHISDSFIDIYENLLNS